MVDLICFENLDSVTLLYGEMKTEKDKTKALWGVHSQQVVQKHQTKMSDVPNLKLARTPNYQT